VRLNDGKKSPNKDSKEENRRGSGRDVGSDLSIDFTRGDYEPEANAFRFLVYTFDRSINRGRRDPQ
jgi:hypothetical protein